MATLFRRGKIWWIDAGVAGQRLRWSLDTADERIARHKLKKYEYEQLTGDLTLPSVTPLAIFLQAFCEHLEAARSHKGYKNDVSYLRTFFGPVYAEHEIQAVFRDGAIWGEKVQITDNTDPDIQPAAGFDASGRAIVAWTTIAGVTGDETLAEMKAEMEIAYSVYDDGVGTWDTPVQLTEDGSLDALPQIVRGADGSTNLIWLHSGDNSLPIGPDEPLGTPPAVLVARWNGVEFGEPQVLIPACGHNGSGYGPQRGSKADGGYGSARRPCRPGARRGAASGARCGCVG